MVECEGENTAQSFLLSRFRTLLKFCYYDDSCNRAKYAVLRTPWVKEECLAASDRFQYRGHKCSIVCYPDSYSMSGLHRTSDAEFINQQWNFSESYTRFLKKRPYTFLGIKSTFVSICARIRDKRGTKDFGDKHFQSFVGRKRNCDRIICTKLEEEDLEE